MSIAASVCTYTKLTEKSGAKAGVIDSDYRGEILVLLENAGNDDFPIKRGDKIAQIIILPVPKMEMEVVETLSTTKRSTANDESRRKYESTIHAAKHYGSKW